MSQQNVERVRRAIEAFNDGGAKAIAENILPDFETTTPPSMSVEPDTYRGPEGVQRWLDSWDDTMEDIRFEIFETFDGGDKVVASLRLLARSHSTGIEFEQRMAQVWTLDGDGRARRLETFPTLEEAMEAAGLQR